MTISFCVHGMQYNKSIYVFYGLRDRATLELCSEGVTVSFNRQNSPDMIGNSTYSDIGCFVAFHPDKPLISFFYAFNFLLHLQHFVKIKTVILRR